MAERVEEEPSEQQSQNWKHGAHGAAKEAGGSGLARDGFLQAFGAQDAIFMFGDAFAAEVSEADGAARRGFPEFVMETTLMDHSLFPSANGGGDVWMVRW